MKTLLKYTFASAVICGMILAVFAFVLKKPSPGSIQEQGNPQSHPFPELLVRNEALKQAAEWQSHVHRVSALSRRLIENPQDISALIELAQIYTIEARVTGEHGYYYPAILEMLKKVLVQNGLNEKQLFEATALKANVLLAQHRFHEGLLIAEKAHAINPHSAQVFAAMIDAHVELGHYEKAVELTDQMMDVRPGLMAYARASYLRELHGDLDGAIQAMQLAVEAGYPGYENTEWCRVHLAGLFEKKGDLDEAEAQYHISMQYRENNPFAQAGVAGIMIERGKFTEAESLLKSALAAAPEIGFQEQLFKLYTQWNNTEEAAKAYAGVISMVEDDAAHGHQVDLDYATILFELGGDAERALEMISNEYLIRPDNIIVNGLMARIYAKLGKTELARWHFAKATRTGYNSPSLKSLG